MANTDAAVMPSKEHITTPTPTTTWYPARLLSGSPASPYGIIILNQPINAYALNAVIEQAALLVCADAGGDRLMAYDRLNPDLARRLPDAVVGDLDSVSPEALRYYEGQGIRIAKDEDQYSTDFNKSLMWMREEWGKVKGARPEQLDVVVMGGLGGRVDQGFSQIHHLYRAMRNPDLLRGVIYLLSEQGLTFALADGLNEIHVNDTVFAENVGIIPVLGPTCISTSGFEWDVDDWPTELGGQLSTSNHIRSDLVTVTVHGSRPLFTLELAKSLCADDSDSSVTSKSS